MASSFSAFVEYRQPSLEELRQMFDRVSVNCRHEFEPTDACRGVSSQAREIQFELVHLGKVASTDEVLAELASRRLRPALYVEFLAFSTKFPSEQREYEIGVLGSFVDAIGYRHAPSLEVWPDQTRYLCHTLFERRWDANCRFLAVSREA